MKITILGCGPSGGVPLLGCDCAVCASDNPKNKRTRTSILLEIDGFRLLVDSSPDLRQQCLAHDIFSVDAIFYTHAHADHCHGIDDIRSLNFHKNGAIDIYADAHTLSEIRERFAYIFTPHNLAHGYYKPLLTPHEFAADAFMINEKIKVQPFLQQHGKTFSQGFRIGNFAYSTDVTNFPAESEKYLENLDLWIVDCLRITHAPTHAHLEQSLKWIERFRPKRAVLIHMGHELEYADLLSQLPDNVAPAYDGMTIAILQ